jgi:hypothetical protein
VESQTRLWLRRMMLEHGRTPGQSHAQLDQAGVSFQRLVLASDPNRTIVGQAGRHSPDETSQSREGSGITTLTLASQFGGDGVADPRRQSCLPSSTSSHPLATPSSPWIGVAAIAFAGVVLMIFGFAAVYSRLHQGAGALGLVGRLHRRSPTCCKPARSRGRSSIAGKPSSATLLRDGILRDHPLVHAFKAGASATIYGCATVAPADSLTPNTCRSIRSSPLSPNTRTPVASRDCGWSLR